MAAIIKTVQGLALASVKTFNGLAAASLKTINGQDATSGGGGGSSLLTDLAAYWKLDEASGATRNDSVGTAHLANNGTVGSATGIQGNAATFGSGNYLSVATSSAIETGDIDFTLAGWVKLTNVTTHRPIIQKGWDDAYGEYLISYNDSFGRYAFAMANGGATVFATTYGLPNFGTWEFIVARYDATANEMSICVNNGTVETASQSGGNSTVTGNLKLGLAFGVAMVGSIDEWGYWKRKLTALEITELYNSGAGKTHPF